MPDAFLRSSEEFQLQLTVRWPAWKPKGRRNLEVRLAAGTGGGNPTPVRSEQISRRNCSRLRVKLPPRCFLKCDWLDFELLTGRPPGPWAKFRVWMLDASAARRRVIETLQVAALRLWVRNPSECQFAEVVGPSSGALVAELNILPSPFHPLIEPFKAMQHLELLSPGGRVLLHQQVIKLTGQGLRYRGPPIPLDDERLFSQPGNYRLVLRIDSRDIAEFPFQLVSDSEALGRIEVPRIQINALTRLGDWVAGVNTLRWEEHRAFQALLQIRSRISCPDLLVVCQAVLRDGNNILRREDFLLPVTSRSRIVKLQPVELGAAGLPTRPQPARLSLDITVNAKIAASALVLVLPPERITTFEGQLRFEVTDLPFDEAEYGQIVRRLGLGDSPRPPHGLLQWLRTKLN